MAQMQLGPQSRLILMGQHKEFGKLRVKPATHEDLDALNLFPTG
jgi:hypothetical protein